MSNPVVITRPLAQADALAQRVAASGREGQVFPLLDIHPLEDQSKLKAALKNLSGCALVAFVSPNAIDAVFALLESWPRAVAIGVMGEGSRAALARHGVTPLNARIISPLDPERTDSQTLLQALDLDALRGKRVMIMRGESGRELLADELRAAGIRVAQIAAYRRAAPHLDEARRAQLTRLLDSPHDWIITSSEALRILVQMAKRTAGSGGVAKMQQQRIIVPHARIAETARMLGFTAITLTGSGDERLLAALQS